MNAFGTLCHSATSSGVQTTMSFEGKSPSKARR